MILDSLPLNVPKKIVALIMDSQVDENTKKNLLTKEKEPLELVKSKLNNPSSISPSTELNSTDEKIQQDKLSKENTPDNSSELLKTLVKSPKKEINSHKTDSVNKEEVASPLKSENSFEHRISCHRCGNIRKRRYICSRSSCPHTFCGRCSDKLKVEHGMDIFENGCPVCKDLCCCSNKSIRCLRKNHCYRKCPATKLGSYSSLSNNSFNNSSSNANASFCPYVGDTYPKSRYNLSTTLSLGKKSAPESTKTEKSLKKMKFNDQEKIVAETPTLLNNTSSINTNSASTMNNNLNSLLNACLSLEKICPPNDTSNSMKPQSPSGISSSTSPLKNSPIKPTDGSNAPLLPPLYNNPFNSNLLPNNNLVQQLMYPNFPVVPNSNPNLLLSLLTTPASSNYPQSINPFFNPNIMNLLQQLQVQSQSQTQPTSLNEGDLLAQVSDSMKPSAGSVQDPSLLAQLLKNSSLMNKKTN